MYIDDILMQMCGTPAERTRQLACVLLLLAVLGFPVALHKVAFGPDLEWIGARFTWGPEGLVVSVPAKRRDEVLGIIERVCAAPVVPRKALRELAGKLSSLAGIVPYLAAFTRSCHKVAAEHEGEGLACTKQVAHDLRWAHSVLARERGADITRVYRLRSARAQGGIGRQAVVRDALVEEARGVDRRARVETRRARAANARARGRDERACVRRRTRHERTIK